MEDRSMSLKKVFEAARFSQVALVVRDIEEVKKNWAAILGEEVPPTSPYMDPAIVHTKVLGKEAPDANSKLAFFNLVPGVQLELIEPNEAHSVWRDEMERLEEGLHHIAFTVDNIDEVAQELVDEYDAVIEQEGLYADASGKYIYLDLKKKLKVRIELLESFNNK